MNRTIGRTRAPASVSPAAKFARRRAIRGGLALAMALLLAACGGDAAPDKAAKGSAPKPPHDPNVITLGQDLKGLVRLGPVTNMEVSDILRIAGRLEVNANRTARIGAPVTGRIVDIKALLGQDVRQGEVLAELNSQDTTSAQLAFLKAHSAEQLASRGVERAQLLLAADVIGSAELQRRQGELTVARAEKRAAADQLRVLGLSLKTVAQLEATGTIVASTPITSTQAGTVIERKVAVGQVVAPSDSLFVVSDLSSVWAVADVPEQEADTVRRGQRVEIEVPALGNEKRAGVIVFVADVVNPETRTVRVGVVLENPGRTLKPAMLTNMLIEGKVSQRTVVPVSAVVRENDADHIFVQVAPGSMRLTRVKLGPEKNGVRPLLDKMPENTGIALEGAFHLNNERQKRNLERGG
ncbi:MAG: efflux RND transporter periplasmic adaptor subunit [Burkholderiales bacterium]|nr:efflux RND transporter periplasmic adaptor subunit [Burkholderiales bacterium]